MKAAASGIKLSAADAAIVKGMLERGDRQHDIAAWFGVNGGRIAEVSTGDRFPEVQAAQDNLPPPGPYVPARLAKQAVGNLQAIRTKLASLSAEVDERIAKLGG